MATYPPPTVGSIVHVTIDARCNVAIVTAISPPEDLGEVVELAVLIGPDALTREYKAMGTRRSSDPHSPLAGWHWPEPAPTADPNPADLLTTRQLEIIATVLATGSQKDAAADLGIEVQTIKTHLTEAYRRLGVESMVEAAYLLWCRGAVAATLKAIRGGTR